LRPGNQSHAYWELYADLPLWERQARSFAYALLHEPVRLFPGERVNGMFYGGGEIDPQWYHPDWGADCAVTAATQRVRSELPEFGALWQQWPEIPLCEGEPPTGGGSFLIDEGGRPGHIAWNYDLILSLGVEGLIERHRHSA
jgi:hypothetical protein